AGIVAGDIILGVNGAAIKSFEELRMFISQYDIGEEMKLSVQRGTKKLELSAKLGDNPNPR
ncbi:MAG: PDZ domain-containing protein, partial [Planctomycetota bacterium]